MTGVAAIENARARRAEAVRLRMEAVSLRLATRQKLRRLHESVAAAHTARAKVHGLLDAPQPSPWSDLLWRTRDDEVECALVLARER